MTVKEIVTERLKANGFGGLCERDGNCGCDIDDLGPCSGGIKEDCSAGWKIPCPNPGDCDCRGISWHITTKRPAQPIAALPPEKPAMVRHMVNHPTEGEYVFVDRKDAVDFLGYLNRDEEPKTGVVNLVSIREVENG